ncbi:MAG: tRNA pseudouridine(38-40) synthase TruA [Candidatus Hydrogenedentes bacterium]|nr:tRNA pseudouridine(38-40) synthase TruA [Candidatus Hydrogenedentota bacterium]
MNRLLKAVIRYDGAPFSGWQIQPGRRTVQGDIEAALSRIASAPIRIHGAGRTDAGVHALGQVCSFTWPGDHALERLRRSLSKMLSPDVQITRLDEAPAGFDARRSARAKRYAYAFALSREPDPLSARYAWCVPWPVDLDRLAALATRFVGRRDFAGFQSSGASVETTVRTLHAVAVEPGGVIAPLDAAALWRLTFHGDGFLYKMVRNLTGTLIDVARGRLPETRIDELLASPGPFHGHTAPAHGLTLLEVIY